MVRHPGAVVSPELEHACCLPPRSSHRAVEGPLGSLPAALAVGRVVIVLLPARRIELEGPASGQDLRAAHLLYRSLQRWRGARLHVGWLEGHLRAVDIHSVPAVLRVEADDQRIAAVEVGASHQVAEDYPLPYERPSGACYRRRRRRRAARRRRW